MKKRSLSALFVMTIAVSSFISCSKGDDDAAKSKTELISSGSWRFSSATVSGFDASGSIPTCQKDNTLQFTTTSGAGTMDEGATKCNTGDPQTVPFTWSFQNGETTLDISTALFAGGSGTFKLESLTATQLVLSQTITLAGTPQTIIVTFIH